MNRWVFMVVLQATIVFTSIGQAQHGQNTERFSLVNSQTHELTTSAPITAVAIKCDCDAAFSIVLKRQSYLVPRDPDSPTPTYFLSLPAPTNDFRIEVDDESVYDLFLIYSGDAPDVGMAQGNFRSNACFEPLYSVPQSEWRTGLPAPTYTRSFHEVNHNIVHHSAGSNVSTDFVQIVRDIYIFHTEVNGWSDIGYNYLIVQDGTIFSGRDPDGGSQDAVRGAHFCGQNSGTLGICLLGNYETATPSSQALTSLESLLTYQLLAQEHDAFASFSHPVGILGAIAGHRDGCSTLCPGENMYSMLNELRTNVATQIDRCDPFIPLSVQVDSTLVKVGDSVHFEALGSYDDFQWFFQGAFPSTTRGKQAVATYNKPGTYDVRVLGFNEGQTDTLTLPSFIQSSTFMKEPIVFPNPLTPDRMLYIDSQEEINEVLLRSTSGQVLIREKSAAIDLNGLLSGVYVLYIHTPSQITVRKIWLP